MIIYDRRGSNRSERPDPYETTSVREHADDALALMRSLDAEPAILVGRSYGGTIALDLALRQPAAVLGIALLEAGPMGLSAEYDEWFVSVRAAVENVEPDAVGVTVIRAVLGAWEELPDVWRDVFTRNGPALLAELRGAERTDNDRFGELSVPALVVTANASPEPIQRCSETLARALSGAHAARIMDHQGRERCSRHRSAPATSFSRTLRLRRARRTRAGASSGRRSPPRRTAGRFKPAVHGVPRSTDS